MNKRLLKAAVATALTVAFAVPAFAAPAASTTSTSPTPASPAPASVTPASPSSASANFFTDVPAKHWSYDAVNKLAKAGVITGYGDGTFKGDKTVTRYEMAAIVASAMQKNLNGDQKEAVDKLSQEFAAELESMGIRVDNLETKVDNMVKISGDARVRYFNTENASDTTDYRARVSFDGKVNDSLKFNARLSSGNTDSDAAANTVKFDTANVTFDVIGLTNTIGRQDIKLGTGFLIDTQMNGITAKAGDLRLFGGRATSNAGKLADGTTDYPASERVYGAEYGFNVGNAKVNVDYMKNASNEDEFFGANTAFKLTDGLSANAEYFQNDDKDASAAAYGLKFDNIGLAATYRDVEANAYTGYSTLNNTSFYGAMSANGFKGMEYQYDRDLVKNVNLIVKYQDFETQNGTKLDNRTSAVVNVKF